MLYDLYLDKAIIKKIILTIAANATNVIHWTTLNQEKSYNAQ